MGIDPEHPDSLVFSPGERRDSGDRPYRNRVIATENQGKVAEGDYPFDFPRNDTGCPGNLTEVPSTLIPDFELLDILDHDVAVIDDFMAQLPQSLVETGNPDS
jgi:hypothetical protein